MSEGDVSLIHDEDVLRRMWQQTDDFGRKKEIRAHMYRLREERLRNFYSSPDIDVAVVTHTTSKDTAKGGQFSSQSHTDSFADQSFQSLKSKEVRDSGSPTRDYAFKIQEAESDQSGGWVVQKESKSSDDGQVSSQTTRSHMSGTKNVDGGKASFAGLNEQQVSVTVKQDENTNFRKDENSSKSAKNEHFVKETEDGSTVTSSKSSSQQYFSKTLKSSTNNADTVNFVQDKTSLVDQEKNRIIRNLDNEDIVKLTNKELITNNFENSQRNNETRTIDEGTLISRKEEHPDENTVVITETRTLSDGTKVTSRTTESKGRTAYSTKSNIDIKSDQRNIDTEDRKVRHVESNISSGNQKININKNDFEDQNVDVSGKRIVSDFINKEATVNILSVQQENNVDNKPKNNSHGDTQQMYDVLHKSTIYDVSGVPKEQLHSVKQINEETKLVDKSNNYTTTYQSDYTNKQRISTDLSPTHQAWASTLRSDSPVPERKSPSRHSTSQTSLRSSQSPEKAYPSRNRPSSPEKFDRYHGLSSDRDSTTKSVINSQRLSTERLTNKSSYDKRNIHTKLTSPERSPKLGSPVPSNSSKRTPSYSKSPERRVSPDRLNTNRHGSPAPSNYSTGTYTYENDRKTANEHSLNKQKKNLSPERKFSIESPIKGLKEKSPESVSIKHTTTDQKKSQVSTNYSSDTYKIKSNIKSENKTANRTKTVSPEQSPKFGSPLLGEDSTNKYVLKNSLKDHSDINRKSPDRNSKERYGSPAPSNYSTGTYTHDKESKDFTNKEDINRTYSEFSKNVTDGRDSPAQSYCSTDTYTREKNKNSQEDFLTENLSKFRNNDLDDDHNTKHRHAYSKSPPTSSTRSKTTPSTIQSRDSSPTTSVSEIEFISTHHNRHLITDLDDVDINYGVNKLENVTSTPRSTSKSDSPLRANSPETVDLATNDVKKSRERPPFTRSETYEDRCRKILGMPDKKTLVKDAEKTLSEILSILPQNSMRSDDSSSVSPYSSSPEREITSRDKDSPKRILSEYPSQRKSLSPDRRVRIMDVVDFITIEKNNDEKNRKLSKVETVLVNKIKNDTDITLSNPTVKNQIHHSSPYSSRSSSPDKASKSIVGTVITKKTVNTIQDNITTDKKTEKRRSPSPSKPISSKSAVKNQIRRNSPYSSRSPSPDKTSKSVVDTIITKKTVNTIQDNITTDKKPEVRRSPSPSKSVASKSTVKNKIRHSSPYSSRSPSPDKTSKNIAEIIITNKTVNTFQDNITTDKKTQARRSPSPSKPISSKSAVKNQIHHNSPYSSRSPSPDKASKVIVDTIVTNKTVNTFQDNITTDKKTQARRSPSPSTPISSKSAVKNQIRHSSPYSSRSPSPDKASKSIIDTVTTKKTVNTFHDKKITNKKTETKRSPSPSKLSDTKKPSDKHILKPNSKSTSPAKEEFKYSSKSTEIIEETEKLALSRNSSPKTKPNDSQKQRSTSPVKKINIRHSSSINESISSPKETINQRQMSPSKSMTRTPSQTEYPTQSKSSPDNVKADRQKVENNKTDTSISKTATSTYRKTTKVIDSYNTNISKTDRTKSAVVDSSSDTEAEKITVRRRKSIDKLKQNSVKTKNPSPTRPANEVSSKVLPNNSKIIRTTSDLTMKSQAKIFPIRNKSKPEINVTRTSSSRSMNKQTTTTSIITKQLNKTEIKQHLPTKLTTKPKSATTLNTNTDEDNVIIDIQHAKSSRENSPDKICPLPVGLNEETGKPRFPDQVSEPDDEKPKTKYINTIHESESLASLSDSKIVELSDNDETRVKNSENFNIVEDHETDECLLSVNQKVSKFLIEAEKSNKRVPKGSTPARAKVNSTDSNGTYIMDDSLPSVSDKVSKFLAAVDKSQTNKISAKTPITDECYKTNIPDKSSLFPKVAKTKEIDQNNQKATKIIKETEHNSNKINQSLKIDSQKTSVHEVKTKYENHDTRRDSITKDTVSSHAKAFDSQSPNLKSPVVSEKSPVKNTNLRSSEAVKKAKALFENIVTQKPESKPKDSLKSATKLTDIGVFKTSKVEENQETDINSTVTDSELDIEIDIAPNVKSDKIQYSKGTYNRPVHQPGNYLKTQVHSSPERNVSKGANEKVRIKDECSFEKTSTHHVLSRFPQRQRTKSPEAKRELFSKSKVETNKAVLSNSVDDRKFDNGENEIEDSRDINSRRGSGKFGIELRRTSTERISTERRRSSVGDHLQPCIEDIQDLALLEQMLERVVGYEQRRRIRAQIRLVKKSKDDKTLTRTTDKANFTKTSIENKYTTRNLKTLSQNILNTERSGSARENTNIDENNKYTNTTNIRTHSSDRVAKRVDQQNGTRKSPDKKENAFSDRTTKVSQKSVDSLSPDRRRRQSPDKRVRPSSPVKLPQTNKIKPTNYNEYTTAYMKKIGIDIDSAVNKSRRSPVNIEKVTKTESFDTKRKSSIEVEKTTIISSSDRRTSKSEVELVHRNGTKSPSPDNKRKLSQNDRLYKRSPSPDFKRPRDGTQTRTEYQSSFASHKNQSTTNDNNLSGQKTKNATDKPIWATSNILRKTDSTETRKFTAKKAETDKNVKRAPSPSKSITKPTDLITSSYGVGPTDENGKPLFGIRALRLQNGNKSNYEVKGTVVKKEFHSRNGGEPVGEISITAYSSKPEDLTRFLTDREIKQSFREDQNNQRGITSITATKKFGSSAGNTMSKLHTERAAITQAPEPLLDLDRKVVRRGSVKSLTEKFIKNAVETTKTEKDPYPKAGLILRSGRRSSGSLSSGSSTHDILACAESNASISSEETSFLHTRTESNVTSSFLNSNTKVTGVQDILSRMKNADIVIQEGDSSEDAEARALLNKFLGATCLMTGMESCVTQKPQSRQFTQESKSRISTKSSSTSAKEIDLNSIWDERVLRSLLDECVDYERRRLIRVRLRQVMAEQEACAQIVADAVRGEPTTPTTPPATSVVKQQSTQEKEKSTKIEGSTVKTVTSEKTTNVTSTKETKVSESSKHQAAKPVSPFAKFKQLEKQNSTPTSPSSPKTPLTPGGTQPLFRFTDPQLQASAATIKERLLQWCRDKTKEYENVKLDNFSTSWSDGLGFCALIHHFLPDSFNYAELTAETRRHNFTLAFKVADEKAGIFPLLDVDDMVTMRKPDWKCVFTYVQAIHRRFKDQN